MKDILIGGFRFRCDNELEIQRAKTLFTKEEGTIDWLKTTLRPGDVFADVGANIGLYTIFAASLVGPTGRVYAFEPHVANAASLMRNVRVNQLADRVRLLTVALSDSEGITDFNYQSVNPGSSDSQLGHTQSESGKEFLPKVVELKYATRLDALASTGAIALPAVVKIDVDGNELQVLRGISQIMEKMRSVQVEVHPQDSDAIDAWMRARHFTLAKRHYTANGKKRIEKGEKPEGIVHNAIYNRS